MFVLFFELQNNVRWSQINSRIWILETNRQRRERDSVSLCAFPIHTRNCSLHWNQHAVISLFASFLRVSRVTCLTSCTVFFYVFLNTLLCYLYLSSFSDLRGEWILWSFSESFGFKLYFDTLCTFCIYDFSYLVCFSMLLNSQDPPHFVVLHGNCCHLATLYPRIVITFDNNLCDFSWFLGCFPFKMFLYACSSNKLVIMWCDLFF